MSMLIAFIIFLVLGIVSYVFTRNLFLSLIIGAVGLLFYYGILSIGFHPSGLVPASIRGLFK